MKRFASLILAAFIIAAPISVSAASGLHWNLGKPVIATCKDGSLLNTQGKVAGGLMSIWEWVRRDKCARG